MADTIKIEDIEERVVLVGVSEQDGDDADDSLSELAELVKTAGATVVGTLIQRREKNTSGHVCRHRQGGRDCRACGEYRGNRHCVR